MQWNGKGRGPPRLRLASGLTALAICSVVAACADDADSGGGVGTGNGLRDLLGKVFGSGGESAPWGSAEPDPDAKPLAASECPELCAAAARCLDAACDYGLPATSLDEASSESCQPDCATSTDEERGQVQALLADDCARLRSFIGLESGACEPGTDAATGSSDAAVQDVGALDATLEPDVAKPQPDAAPAPADIPDMAPPEPDAAAVDPQVCFDHCHTVLECYGQACVTSEDPSICASYCSDPNFGRLVEDPDAACTRIQVQVEESDRSACSLGFTGLLQDAP